MKTHVRVYTTFVLEFVPKCFGKFELFASKICNLGKESESKSENVEVDL